ncbi:MAG: hypothetical protein ACYCQI_14690 [Gammaproteobacteria bacterium]
MIMKYKLNEEQFETLCKSFLLTTFKDILQGKADKESISFFIGKAALMLINNEPLPDEYRVALGHALLKIADGEDAAKIFGQKIGHRSKDDLGHQRSIALHVWTLINIQDYPPKKAIITVAEEPTWEATAETVKHLYHKFKKDFNTEAEKILLL